MSTDTSGEGKVRIHGVKRVRVETPEQYARRLQRRREAKAQQRVEQAEPPIVDFLRSAAAENTLESCVRYFSEYTGAKLNTLRQVNWLANPTPYVGREHVDVAALGKYWLGPMMNWLDSRALKGMETERGPRYGLHILADYLFLYLPWWIELHPDSGIQVPRSPKEFSRFLFISRMNFGETADSTKGRMLPRTFLEMLELRRSSADTFNVVLVHLERFFHYVSIAYEADSNVAGPKLSNPIRLYFDKRKSRKRTKTNKVPFDEATYPHLVHFAQAVEAFGEYLQMLAYEGHRFGEPKLYKLGYDAETWGYIPFVCYRGKVYPVRWIPSVFSIPTREFHTNPEGPAGIYVSGRRINSGRSRKQELRVPHLTLLRMLMGLVETGLRGQGMQWLDRTKWDSANLRPTPIGALYTSQPPETFTKMYVNTDKSKDGPWTTYIPWRLRRSLLAEQYFQESIAEGMIQSEVPYENREHSRFEPVVPMFRAHMTALPYGDDTYSAYWKELLIGFQIYYNSRIGYSSRHPHGLRTELEEPAEFFVLVPRYLPDGATLAVSTGKTGPYCSITWLAVNSPHACRATYATLRDGDLEVAEIAQQLGHDSDVTTTVYQVPSERRLRGKIERLDRKLIGYGIDGVSEEFIHPEASDSAVRQAFTENRDAAIEAFGFVNGVTLWSTDDLDDNSEDALELLRESSASVIKWHPTHVCPVGNQCPADIVPKIGGLYRCGLCPFAAKCVDHLPGIAAKKNELNERIRSNTQRIQKLEASGSEQELVNQLYRQREIDAKELMGWELSEQILHDQVERAGDDGANQYHVHSPELVRRHLQRVVRNRTEGEFFLQRIAESNSYPSMETPEVRARAARYVRVILAKAGRPEEAATLEIEPYEELRCFASLVKPMAEAKGLGLEELAKALEPVATPERLAAGKHRLLEVAMVSGD